MRGEMGKKNFKKRLIIPYFYDITWLNLRHFVKLSRFHDRWSGFLLLTLQIHVSPTVYIYIKWYVHIKDIETISLIPTNEP